MRIKIIHLSDLELNPTLQAKRGSPPWITLQKKLAENPNFRRDTWNWLFNSTIALLDRIRLNKGGDHQLLLISGDVVKGYSTRNQWAMEGWYRFYDKLHEIAIGGTKIILTTGSHDTRAKDQAYPYPYFYNSNHEHHDSPWRVISNPGGEIIDLCDDEISLIGYGDLDGVRGVANQNQYFEGLEYWSTQREALSPRFVIGLSPDHRPGVDAWAGYNIYNYVATGGTEGHLPDDPHFFRRVNDHLVYSQQGRPFRRVGFGHQMWALQRCSFTYGVVDTVDRIATFKDHRSTATEFLVDDGDSIIY
jgi:hypothetical protein